jgi:hypothetical protein
MRQYIDTLQDVNGNALVGAAVLVQNYVGGANAAIFSDNGLTPILTSTVTTGADGQFSFFAADGDYSLVLSKNGTPYKTQSPVSMFDGAAQITYPDVGAVNAYATANAALEKQLRTGLRSYIKIANTNTGPSTYSYNGGTVKALANSDTSALSAGQLIAGGIYGFEYNGTAWQVYGINLGVFYARNAAEIAAGITPTSYGYPPGNLFRYGATGNGVTDDSAAIVQAQQAGVNVSYDTGVFYVGTFVTLTGTHQPHGGKIYVGAGVTVTVNCFVVGDTRVWLSGPGTVAFGTNARGAGGWRPEWFGGKPSQVNPTGNISVGSVTLVVSSATDLETGVGISIAGAGLAPATPGVPALVNNSGSGTAYTIAIAAVHYNGGVSAVSSNTINSGATPNITATWTVSGTAGVVLYLVYVNGVLVGSTPNLSYSVGTAAASGALFTGCPLAAPSAPLAGVLTTLIQGLSGTTVTLAAPAIATVAGGVCKLDCTVALQTCHTACDASYGTGPPPAGSGAQGWRTNAIVFDTGVYNLSSPVIAKGLFSYNGAGCNWNTGSSLVKNQIYANAIIAQGCTYDGLSMGSTFDKVQFVETNVAYTYTPGASNYFFRFMGYNGTTGYQSNSIYFLDSTRFTTINAIWLSHGDDWKISSIFDAGLNFVHQQPDTGLSSAYQWDFKFVGVQGYQPQNFAIYATSVSCGVVSGCLFNGVTPAGSTASAIISLQTGSGASIANVTITGNVFQNTRTVLNALNCSALTFANNSVSLLAGSGLVFSGCNNCVIGAGTWNFQAGQTTNFIVFSSAGAVNTNFEIDGVFDMTNSSALYAITASNATANNTILTSSKIKGRVLGSTARLIDWVDMGSEADITVTYSFAGSYPTSYGIGTFSAMPANTPGPVLEIEWNTSLGKTGVSNGAESGTVNVLLTQSSTAAGAVATYVTGTSTRIGQTNPAGTADATPTTTYSATPPTTTATGTLNLTVTCPTAGAAMASPTLVATTLTLRSKGQPSSQSTTAFAMRIN